MLGAALLVASVFNPMAIRGAGAFLLIVNAVAAIEWPWNPGWSLAAILVLWAAPDVARANRDDPDGHHSSDSRSADDRESETVRASR